MTTEAKQYVMPGAPEIMTLVAFAWAIACYMLVSTDGQILRLLVRASVTAGELFGGGPPPLVPVMLIGTTVLMLGMYLMSKLQRLLIGLLIAAFILADVLIPAVRIASFGFKYLALVFLTAYSALFMLRNLFKLDDALQRWILASLIWGTLVVYISGRGFNTYWYIGTQWALFVGISLAWARRFDSTERLMQFNTWVAYIGIGMTIFHILSPLLVEGSVFDGGRFKSAYEKATGFSVRFTPLVLAMVWLGLADPRVLVRRIGGIFAIIGVCLLLLSGTRNAMGTVIGGILVLSFVFKAQIALYGVAGIFVALGLQLAFSEDDTLIALFNRLTGRGNVEGGRVELWTAYLEAAAKSPIFGYGPEGKMRALRGDEFADLLARSNVRVKGGGMHNALLGTQIRFGLPGLIAILGVFFTAFRRGAKLILNPAISQDDKVAFALPLAMLTAIFLSGIFEDTLEGRATLLQLVFTLSLGIIIAYVPKQIATESKVPIARVHAAERVFEQ